jgi:succinate dehydrogenase hydrophobic anchor subunit
VLAHAWSAFTLVRRNAAARPVPYKHARRDQATNYAARTMPITGVLVALYIVYHIMHLTLGVGVAAHDPQNPFNNVVHGFSNPLIAGVYIVANVLLGTHLFHGGYAWFNSLGLSNPRYAGMKRGLRLGPRRGLITLGNVALPVSRPRGRGDAHDGDLLLARARPLRRPRGRAGPLSGFHVRLRHIHAMELRSNVPSGPIEKRWEKHRFDLKLVNPANRRKSTVIVVGTGLAGGASPPPRWASWATTSTPSATKTAPAARTPSPRRAASTPPRTTRTTATASTGSSTTR